MKMTKKFLIGAVALVAAAMFTSCGIKNDNAETSGTKTNKDVEVDATSATFKYKRAVVQLGSLEQVQACTTTVRYPKAYDDADNVIGFIFDLNYNKDDKGKDISDSYNFVLVGYNPSTEKWYADHLENVSMKANNGQVNAGALLSEKKERITENTLNDKLFKELKKEIESLEQDKKDYQDQINQLQEQLRMAQVNLNQSQQLQLEQSKKIKELEAPKQDNDKDETKETTSGDDETDKKSFWERVFGN